MTRSGSKPGSIFEGRTLDDAVRKGLEALGLSRAEVMITMLEEGSSGFLGLGARPYKVRIMPRPGGAIQESGERPEGGRRERSRGGRDRNERGARRGAADGRRAAAGPVSGRDRPRDERRGSPARPGAGAPPARREPEAPMASPRAGAGESASGYRGERGEDGQRPRRRGRRGGREPGREGLESTAPGTGHGLRGERDERPAGAVTEETRAPRSEAGYAGEAERVGATLAPGQLEADGKRWTEELFKAMGFEATVTATAELDRVDVTATVPEHEDLLTGRKGEVRQALQHLLNRMINRGEGTRYHLQLEINDFWKRREDELNDIARRLANEAVENRSEVVTEYLNAQERRVIHVTLRDDNRVKTYALGSGMIKRLAVAPADFAGGSEEGE